MAPFAALTAIAISTKDLTRDQEGWHCKCYAQGRTRHVSEFCLCTLVLASCTLPVGVWQTKESRDATKERRSGGPLGLGWPSIEHIKLWPPPYSMWLDDTHLCHHTEFSPVLARYLNSRIAPYKFFIFIYRRHSHTHAGRCQGPQQPAF